jgi:hypothetical protein
VIEAQCASILTTRQHARNAHIVKTRADHHHLEVVPHDHLHINQKSESAWCEACAQPPAWLLPRREPVLEALYVQCVASEDSDLNLHRIGGVILV